MRHHPPRVCLVTGSATGGMGAHVRALSERLTARGSDVSVVGPQSTDDLYDFTRTGSSFVPVEISASPGVMDLPKSLALRRAVAQADLVHAHGLRAGFLTSMALVRKHVPLVVTLHNAVLATGARRHVFSAIERVVARRATVVLGVSSDLVRRMAELGASDARLAPVGAERMPSARRTREQVRRELDVRDGQAMVLAVARLAHQKGLDVLLAAAQVWRNRADSPVLVVAGSGPDEQALRAQATDLGIEVRFLGRRSDVPDLMAAADVVVLASRWEGSPLTAHEVLQAGRPLVATSVGGVPDLVATPDGPAALLVPAEDPAQLAAGVAQVLDDAELGSTLVDRGRARAETWPDAEQTIASVLQLYDELVEVER